MIRRYSREAMREIWTGGKGMKANLNPSKGLIYSQAILLALTQKGAARKKACALVQSNAMKTWAGTGSFKDSLLEGADVLKHLTKREIEKAFDLKIHLRYVDNIFKKVGIT